MSETLPSFQFSGPELYLLGSLAGAETLIGVRDPFYGWLTEEIVEALATVRSDLLASGHLSLQHDGIAFAPQLAPLITSLATPRVVLMTTVTGMDGAAQERAYHASAAGVTRLTTEGQQQYYLEGLAPSALASDICGWWGLVQQPSAPGMPFRLTQEALLAVRDSVADQATAVAALVAAGADPASAASFAGALAAPLTNGSLAVLRRVGAGWDVTGTALLESATGLWQLRAFEHQDVPWVEVAPVEAGAMAQRIERLVQQALGAADLE